MTDIQCLCKGTLHPLGSADCEREVVPDNELPQNHQVHPLGIVRGLDPHYKQRVYFKHPKGVYSRLKESYCG